MKQLTFQDLQSPGPIELLTPSEIYDRADEALLRQLREDRRVEKKPNRFNLRDLGDYLSMWANTQPHGGLIVIGIRDDLTFEGMLSAGASDVNEIERATNTFCADAKCTSKRVPIHRDGDGAQDYVLLFRVDYHKTRVVRTSSGNAYIRLGHSKHKLSEPEIRLLQADKGEIHPEKEPVGLEYPKDYLCAELESFCQLVRQGKGWKDEHSAEDTLELMHLGRRQGEAFKPNLACALLFAKDPQLVIPGCKIRFLRFEGETEGTGEKWNAVKDEMCEGTIIQQIQQAAEVIRSQLRTFSRLG